MSELAWSRRRQSPRKTVEELTFVNFGSNNRGVILNISEGGLGFRAIGLAAKSGTRHFWFLLNGYPVDAQGEVMWVDEIQKTGGLRFTELSTEAREQLRNWMLLSDTDPTVEKKSGPPDKGVAASAPTPRKDTLQKNPPSSMASFSRGLVSGLLISSLVGALILSYGNRRQFGDSRIEVGERLASRASPETTSPIPSPIPSVPFERSPSSGIPDNLPQAKIENAEPAVLIKASASPATAQVPNSASIPLIASQDDKLVSDSTSFTLQVGAMRNKENADALADSLGQKDFPVFISKPDPGHLYIVTVGPYESADAAQKASDELAKLGIQAILERNSIQTQ